MANHNTQCAGCRYNTPRCRGGVGKLCTGESMRLHNRCPEWAAGQYVSNCQIVGQNIPADITSAVMESNRLCKV